MVLYNFLHWEDATGSILGTSPILTVNVLSDITLRAVYIEAKRNVTFNSIPIAVQASLNGSPINSGQTAQVSDGSTITITVPPVVTS